MQRRLGAGDAAPPDLIANADLELWLHPDDAERLIDQLTS